jgi:hypothetical protein
MPCWPVITRPHQMSLKERRKMRKIGQLDDLGTSKPEKKTSMIMLQYESERVCGYLSFLHLDLQTQDTPFDIYQIQEHREGKVEDI